MVARQVLVPAIYSFCGPMFSGKSTELRAQADRYFHAGYKIQAFRLGMDDRFTSAPEIITHSNLSLEATLITPDEGRLESAQLLLEVHPETNIVVIDEAQFYDPEIVSACLKLRDEGRAVLTAFLDMDFRREPFKFKGSDRHVGELMARSRVRKLTAVCKFPVDGSVCGAEAEYSRRIEGGAELVQVGGADSYIATCLEHHNAELP